MHPAVRIDNLSKVYTIGARQRGYQTLREAIVETAAAPLRRLTGRAAADAESTTHWALRDVSFEIAPGRIVGIIGRNGAGKSTLLKVLSRITEPTTGRVELRGRVVSLLEVGTGFHQELTGRENIYLNGAILGMSRREIARKFDEIVAFAEIEKFLDTPAKRYSSGMYIRLAFAVAAHLDAEILVVDEVLAVGDAAFQKKCLDRIRELRNGGGTVLIVSHNMGTVASLCQDALILDQGRVLGWGPAREQVGRYMSSLGEKTLIDVANRTDRGGTGAARIVSVQFLDGDGRPTEAALVGEPLTLRFGYRAERPLSQAMIHAWVCNQEGMNLTILSSRYTGDLTDGLPERGFLDCRVSDLNLMPGRYLISVRMMHGLEPADEVQGAATLDVAAGPFFPTGQLPAPENALFLTRYRWTLTAVPEE